jgi:hypothetical protein
VVLVAFDVAEIGIVGAAVHLGRPVAVDIADFRRAFALLTSARPEIVVSL